jgi:hypothetical protein
MRSSSAAAGQHQYQWHKCQFSRSSKYLLSLDAKHVMRIAALTAPAGRRSREVHTQSCLRFEEATSIFLSGSAGQQQSQLPQQQKIKVPSIPYCHSNVPGLLFQTLNLIPMLMSCIAVQWSNINTLAACSSVGVAGLHLCGRQKPPDGLDYVLHTYILQMMVCCTHEKS